MPMGRGRTGKDPGNLHARTGMRNAARPPLRSWGWESSRPGAPPPERVNPPLGLRQALSRADALCEQGFRSTNGSKGEFHSLRLPQGPLENRTEPYFPESYGAAPTLRDETSASARLVPERLKPPLGLRQALSRADALCEQGFRSVKDFKDRISIQGGAARALRHDGAGAPTEGSAFGNEWAGPTARSRCLREPKADPSVARGRWSSRWFGAALLQEDNSPGGSTFPIRRSGRHRFIRRIPPAPAAQLRVESAGAACCWTRSGVSCGGASPTWTTKR
jgi:hypothetical protein